MASRSESDSQFQPPPMLEEAWNRYPGIVKLGDPVLRQVAEPVAKVDAQIRALIQRMTRLMRDAHGLGLAAPQAGVSRRVIIYDARDEEGLQVLINPRIVSRKGEQVDPPEGCLSIPGLQGVVTRALEIKVRAFDARNRPITIKATELTARVIQHEVDHLNGVLFIDHADPDTLEWVIAKPDDEDEDEDEEIERADEALVLK